MTTKVEMNAQEPSAKNQILSRVKRLRDSRILDGTTYAILEGIEKRDYLSSLEEEFLELIEEYYGIKS